MQENTKLLPISQRRSGITMEKVLYICAHDTANPNASAITNVNYYIASANDMQASAHAFVDDTEVLWCIPETEKAWHVRYDAGIAPNVEPHFFNDCALGIELCYFDDLNRTKQAYANYVALIAKLCSKHGIDPNTGIVAHADLDPTRRKDPYNVFQLLGITWSNFINDILKELTPNMDNTEQAKGVTESTPQHIVIKKIEVTYDKFVEGQQVATDLTVTVAKTPDVVNALAKDEYLVLPNWNITVE